MNTTTLAGRTEISRPRIVTTSWDDGYPKDLKLAELLAARSLPGTFYVPICGVQGRPVLNKAEICELAGQDFEIGAHGYLHRNLTDLCAQDIRHEVTLSVGTLQDYLGKSVQMFCYPNGRYNSTVVRTLEDAGLRGCRTTIMLHTNLNFRSFEMPVTLQAYPHNRTAYLRNLANGKNFGGAWSHITRPFTSLNWVDLGRTLFDIVMREGGVWHLYGHSWEIEEMGLWSELEEMLNYVSHQRGVRYLRNYELLNYQSGFPVSFYSPEMDATLDS